MLSRLYLCSIFSLVQSQEILAGSQDFWCQQRWKESSAMVVQQLSEHLRARSAECMSFEAARRVEDPVYGCAGIISHLHQQILEAQEELSKVQCQIAYHCAKLQIQLGNWMTPIVHGSRDDTASVSMPGEFVHQLQQHQSSLPASVSDSHFTVDFTREEPDEFNLFHTATIQEGSSTINKFSWFTPLTTRAKQQHQVTIKHQVPRQFSSN